MSRCALLSLFPGISCRSTGLEVTVPFGPVYTIEGGFFYEKPEVSWRTGDGAGTEFVDLRL
jgi:hypothetical protein